MGLFNLFKPPIKILDDTFGELKCYRSKVPSDNFFEGKALFTP
jgi:hypothetical protein